VLELKVHDGSREVVLQFEHSLLSLSKWEAKHKKPFLASTQKRPSEMIDYFECMLLPPGDPAMVYILSPDQLDELSNYISDSQTASSVPSEQSSGQRETITSELIYYWMVALKIPFQPTETWHLNRLMMLVQITYVKSTPPKKKSKSELMADFIRRNEANKKRFNTKG
jgi:hypothetical protein